MVMAADKDVLNAIVPPLAIMLTAVVQIFTGEDLFNVTASDYINHAFSMTITKSNVDIDNKTHTFNL